MLEKLKRINPLEITAFVLILIGIISGGIVIWKMAPMYDLFTRGIDLEPSVEFSDIIGGISGSLWSLSGVILFYAALKYQWKELELQRKAITDQSGAQNRDLLLQLIIAQIEQFNIAVNHLELRDKRSGEIHQGRNAILFLHSSYKRLIDAGGKAVDLPEEKRSADFAASLRPFTNILTKQIDKVIAYIQQIIDSCNAINAASTHLKMSEEETNDLRNLYFESIGRDKIIAIMHLDMAIEVLVEIKDEIVEPLIDKESLHQLLECIRTLKGYLNIEEDEIDPV